MKENPVVIPPAWCGAICRNAMSDVCVEKCALKRDTSGFKPKPDLRLEDMPRFPLEESSTMTREEKFVLVAVYLAKVVDHLQGVDSQKVFNPPYRRQNIHSTSSDKSFGSVKVEDLLAIATTSEPVPEDSASGGAK